MLTRRKLIGTGIAAAGTGWLLPKAFSQAPTAVTRAWDVRSFGAKGDGVSLDTKAVQAAIDACHQAGGGWVAFPTGGTFLIGTIYLRDHVGLWLETNSTLLGSDHLADYGSHVGLNPFYPETIDPCLIYAKGATDIRIGGEGRIVGHLQEDFVPAPGAQGRELKQRPMLIRLEECTRISVTDVTLERCGSWCLHLKRSREIFLRNVRIDNKKQDGFDLESCENVSISDCHLVCGDDAIAVTTSAHDRPSRNITITNCLLRSRWAGIRFGPLSKGDFENITVSNCVIYDCNGGGIKLGTFEGGEIRNCVFDNLIMEDVIAPITMFVATWPEIGSTSANPPMMLPGKIRDLQFRGIRMVTKSDAPQPRPDANNGLFFHGHPQGVIENILLQDITATLAGRGTQEQATRRDIVDMDQIDYRKDGYWTDHKSTWGVPPAYGLYARHIKGLTLDNVNLQLKAPDFRCAIFCMDCEDVRLSNVVAAESAGGTAAVTARNCAGVRLANVGARPKAETLLRVEGPKSGRVTLTGNDARGYAKAFQCVEGASASSVLDLNASQARP